MFLSELTLPHAEYYYAPLQLLISIHITIQCRTRQTEAEQYTVFQKSDAKIEITITTTNLIRIQYPLNSFNYRLSGANVANFNKMHRTVFELFKNGTQKQKFPIWKSRLSSSYTIPSVTVYDQSGRHLHRHLHVSCADRTFSAAAGLPVCIPCSVNLPQKSVQC